jgi:hypothetical protein
VSDKDGVVLFRDVGGTPTHGTDHGIGVEN